MTTPASGDRRELRVRGSAWAQSLARAIAARGVSPNQISVLSIAFAAAGALASRGVHAHTSHRWLRYEPPNAPMKK
jgi:hypothetical protein